MGMGRMMLTKRQRERLLYHPQTRGMSRAEARLEAWARVAHPDWFINDLDELCRWISRNIEETRWFRAISPIRGIAVRVGHGSKDAFAVRDEFGSLHVGDITLPPRFRTTLAACHECAHLLQPVDDDELIDRGLKTHGPEFIGMFLYVVRRALGRRATERFQGMLRDEGVEWVRYQPKRTRRK